MSKISEYTSSLSTRLELLSELETEGWSVEHALESVHVTAADLDNYLPAVARLQQLALGLPVKVTADFGTAFVEFEVAPSSATTVVGGSDGDLSAYFHGPELIAARSVWQGNLARLAELPAPRWKVEIEFSLGATIEGYRFLVSTSVDLLTNVVRATPVWGLGTLFRSGEVVVAVARGLQSGDSLKSACLIVVASVDLSELELPAPRDGSSSHFWAHPLMKNCPGPPELEATTVGQSLADLSAILVGLSATLAWVALATTVTIEQSEARIEFLGFQRVSWPLPRAGIVMTREEIGATQRLYRWAAGGSGTLDHQIAVRQVVSVNPVVEPWRRAADIALAAEPVVVGLRSDAVAEAFRARRDVEQFAQSSALQAAERSAAIARSTIERSTALVIAAAGVFVAQSLDAITADLAEQLRILLGVVFGVLAVWSAVLEGPLVSLPIRTFREDLPKFSPLLSEAEREAIRSMSTLTRAANRARVVRIVVPIVFSGFSIGLLLSAYFG